jgi:plasmid stabilization system protein ParE
LTAGARKDLIAIWNYTSDKWGEAQADNYLRKLEKGFITLTKGEAVVKNLLPSHATLGSTHCGHHYIFFLKRDKPVIIAILHEKMDFIRRLGKRLGS